MDLILWQRCCLVSTEGLITQTVDSVWECVWRCVLPGRACICILLLLGVAPHAAFHRQKILYIHKIYLKIICRYPRFLLIVCNLPRLLPHNTTVLQKVIISYCLQILGAPASPKDCSTYRGRYCMWVYSQAQRLQAEPHYCPISSPQAPEPPPPRPSSSSRWLRCLLAPLLPLGLVAMSKAVRQSVTTRTHKKSISGFHTCCISFLSVTLLA